MEDGNLETNLRLAEQAVRQAAERGADMVNFPEAADWGWLYQQARRDAFPIPGKYTDFLACLATRNRVWITAGCLEKNGERVYNSAIILDRAGQIVLKHRKVNTLSFLTKELYDSGPAEVQTIETEFGRIGLTICADNFLPEIPQRVAEQGAWLLIAPHGFAAEPDKVEQNAREYKEHISGVARRTGLWVIGTDAVLGTVQGGAWKGRLHCGCSMIARPDGTAAVIAKFKEPDLVVFEFGCPAPVAAKDSHKEAQKAQKLGF